MAEKTYIIKVQVEQDNNRYEEMVQALYDLDATDVDLLEIYDN